MQAIETRFLSATGTKPARIVATCPGGGRSVISADQGDKGYGDVSTHWIAANALAVKMGWDGKFIAGGTKDGWVFVSSKGDGFMI